MWIEMCRRHSLVMSHASKQKSQFRDIRRALALSRFLCSSRPVRFALLLYFASFQYLMSNRNIANQFLFIFSRQIKLFVTYGTIHERRGFYMQSSSVDIDLFEVDGFAALYHTRRCNQPHMSTELSADRSKINFVKKVHPWLHQMIKNSRESVRCQLKSSGSPR